MNFNHFKDIITLIFKKYTFFQLIFIILGRYFLAFGPKIALSQEYMNSQRFLSLFFEIHTFPMKNHPFFDRKCGVSGIHRFPMFFNAFLGTTHFSNEKWCFFGGRACSIHTGISNVFEASVRSVSGIHKFPTFSAPFFYGPPKKYLDRRVQSKHEFPMNFNADYKKYTDFQWKRTVFWWADWYIFSFDFNTVIFSSSTSTLLYFLNSTLYTTRT